MRLVFVHGRGQQDRSPEDLEREWMASLTDGFRAAGIATPPSAASVSLPYYGDRLFALTENLGQIERDMVEKGAPVADPALEFEADALVELAAAAGIPDDQIAASAGAEAVAKGPQNWGWVQAIVRTIDGWGGGLSGAAIRQVLRDVYVYTTRGGVAAEVDGIVRDAITQESTVVVAHSLGTVVAYNVLRREGRNLDVPLLVTLGSPLGIAAVRRQLVPLKSPKVGCWYNAFDRRDIVALNPLDEAHFPVAPPILNKSDVDNTTDNRHGISGYLSDPAVARRIHEAISEK